MKDAMLTPVWDVSQLVSQLVKKVSSSEGGRRARTAVLPEGPLTVPYIGGREGT